MSGYVGRHRGKRVEGRYTTYVGRHERESDIRTVSDMLDEATEAVGDILEGGWLE